MKEANEAREKAIDVTRARDSELWNTLEKQIDKAVEKGKLETTYYGHIPQATITLLERLGYTCKQKQTGINEYGFLIEW